MASTPLPDGPRDGQCRQGGASWPHNAPPPSTLNRASYGAGPLRLSPAASARVQSPRARRPLPACGASSNALVEVSPEEALEAADAADRAIAEGAALGPLHGVPVSIKVN